MNAPAILSCTDCRQTFTDEQEFNLHRAKIHPQFVQTIWTPEELKVIDALVLLGAAVIQYEVRPSYIAGLMVKANVTMAFNGINKAPDGTVAGALKKLEQVVPS